MLKDFIFQHNIFVGILLNNLKVKYNVCHI